MSLQCKNPRYRFRQTKEDQQRIAWCGNKVVETKMFSKKNKK